MCVSDKYTVRNNEKKIGFIYYFLKCEWYDIHVQLKGTEVDKRQGNKHIEKWTQIDINHQLCRRDKDR